MGSSQTRAQRIHLIGIGGSGLSAIARLLLESGHMVSGSDRVLSPLAQELADAGARVFAGHRAENIAGADLVVRSSAIPDENAEVQAALAAGIPVLKRAQFLGRLMENRYTFAAAGTHGKTTITAMLAWSLVNLGQDPSYIIGGTAKNLGGRNAHAGKDQAFVIEADEYDRMFLGLNPDVIILSYLEHDHPDCFPTMQEYSAAFEQFVARLRPGGILLASRDNLAASQLVKAVPAGTQAFTYGLGPQSDYTARSISPNNHGGFDYEAWIQPAGQAALRLAQVSLQVPGEHNVRNSLGTLAAIHQAHLENKPAVAVAQTARALGEYSGTGRRFDVQGQSGGITVIDDYAHHPTEIQFTLGAARARYPQGRIWAVWQPHTFSRTRTLQSDFIRSFTAADQVIVTEIYAAREKAADFDNYSASQLVAQMDHPGVHFIPTLEAVASYLLQTLRSGDILLVLSAGDADQISVRVLAELRERSKANA